MNKKRILSVFLSTIITCSMLGTTVFATESTNPSTKVIANSSGVITPNIFMEKYVTVQRGLYATYESIPSSIVYYETSDGVDWSGTLYVESVTMTYDIYFHPLGYRVVYSGYIAGNA